MAYLRGFVHGAVCGMVAGALVAPRPGRETRSRLEATARRWTGRGQRVAAGTEAGWRRAEPVLRAAAHGMGDLAHTAQPMVERAAQRVVELAHRGEPIDAVVVRSTVGTPSANGTTVRTGVEEQDLGEPPVGSGPG